MYRIEKTLKNIETRHSVQKRWDPGNEEFNKVALIIETKRRDDILATLHALSTERYFLLTLKKKYADGQKIAVRLSRQITKVSNNMKVIVEKCNATTDSLREYISGLPERISFDKVKDPTSDLFSDLPTAGSSGTLETENRIPEYTKRKVIDLNSFVKRCHEEEQLLSVEMERLLNYYSNTCSKIDQELASLGDLSKSRHRFSLGARHELLRLRTRLQNQLYELKSLFELPLDETVQIQAEFWNLSRVEFESYVNSEHTIHNDDDDESDDAEEIEELSDIESDSE